MCTHEPGGEHTDFDEFHEIKLETQKNKIMAKDIYFKDEYIYKNDDYHCIKPDSHDDPEKWRKYEVDAFRKAFNQEMLDDAETFKYDKYLYNFVDPEVFKAFTRKEEKGSKIWGKSYGHYYNRMIPGYIAHQTPLNLTRCIKKCIEMEKSKFAKRCSKDGGYFKCCIHYWILGPFEETRNKLIKDGLIGGTEETICDDKSMKNPCLYCSLNGFCTKSDPFTGEITQLFYDGTKTNTSKSKHTIIVNEKVTIEY